MAIPLIPRDLSWLAFNYRVLQEAKDKRNPLLERVKFLAIYSSNLDEFFRVRVAQHHNLLNTSKKTQKVLDYNPEELIKEILKTVHRQQEEFSKIFEQDIVPSLAKNGIALLRRRHLSTAHFEFIDAYFQNNLLPFVQPVLLVKDKIRPFLVNGEVYLAVRLKSKERGQHPEEYGLLSIPSKHLPRFISLPCTVEGRQELIMLDDIVRQKAAWLFPGYTILESYSIKLSRDADLHIDDEFEGDLLEKIKNSLTKRNIGPASRFIYDRDMTEKLLHFLQGMFNIERHSLLPEGRYHNNSDFFKLPDFGKKELKNTPQPPIPYETIEKSVNIFETILQEDHLLYFPYQSYESVVRLFEKAAADPQVTQIQIVQYRVAKKSRIMAALIAAAKSGKNVNVFIEVKARFDEEANIAWGEKLQQAGVNVHYSLPGIKVHTKMALVRRKENGRLVNYAYLGTGNFNEDTAKIYSDFGFLTADKRYTDEITKVFEYLETGHKNGQKFKHLLVGQFNLRTDLEACIEREITNAKHGKTASILLKMNSLQDHTMIELLYKASEAGVKIRLIIRGICCLVPENPKWSKNIEAISIVDRYLEHSRVFCFHNDGKPKIYLSSADWMTRNLSHRVETCFPIYNERHQQFILKMLDIQWNDTIKSRILDKSLKNSYRKAKNGESEIQAQVESYQEIVR
jgi:polyphosphate kinase